VSINERERERRERERERERESFLIHIIGPVYRDWD
jgi:hypothetical protein